LKLVTSINIRFVSFLVYIKKTNTKKIKWFNFKESQTPKIMLYKRLTRST